MKKTMVIGAGGFISTNLIAALQPEYEIIPVHRNDLDLLSYTAVTEFLKHHKPDYIINGFSYGSTALLSEDPELSLKNLQILNNFFVNSNLFNLFVNIGTGNEFDVTRDISWFAEERIFSSFPKNSYGLSKNLIAKEIWNHEKFITLRLFGCFGYKEPEYKILQRYINCPNDVFKVENDRFFDVFSVLDFAEVVKHIFKTDIRGTDMNIVYPLIDKMKLSDLLIMFRKIHGISTEVEVINTVDTNYTGSPYKMLSYFRLKEIRGLEQRLKEYPL